MNMNIVWRGIATLGMVLLASCADLQMERDPTAVSIAVAARAPSPDVAFLSLNRLIPGFAGLSRGPEGEMRVALTSAADPTAARPIVEAFLRAREGSVAKLTFVPAQRSWFDLDAYHRGLSEVLGLPDVVYLDTDELCNCITVAVSNPSAREAVQRFAATAGVPEGALRVIEFKPIVFASSLRDEFRPTKGGVKIKFDVFLSFGGTCTETAVVQRAGTLGLLTNSHCTRTIGGGDGTAIYQSGSVPFGFDFVASELADPAWIGTIPGCPTGRLCRRSDSAFAAFADPANGALGKIALPAAMCGNTPCSTDMNNADDELSISGPAAAPMVGDKLGKIGQTTGFTRGAVSATCVDTNVEARSTFDPANLTVLCQTFVGALLDHGDSGSPVISLLPGNRAALSGVAWGMAMDDSGSPLFLFSPIAAVEAELGALVVVPPPAAGGGNSQSPPPRPRGQCELVRDACMREVPSPGGPRPQQCVAEFRACKGGPDP